MMSTSSAGDVAPQAAFIVYPFRTDNDKQVAEVQARLRWKRYGIVPETPKYHWLPKMKSVREAARIR